MQSRSRWLTIAVLAALFALLVAGCVSPVAPADEAAAPSDDGGANETLVYAVDMTDLITLDPAVAYEFGGIQVVGNVYESLVSFEPGNPGVLVPVLAESWEVTEDGDMWNINFKLDPDAKFASGNPVTAEDVAFSWNRAMEINKSPAFLLTDVCNMVNGEINVLEDGSLELKLPNTVSPQVCLSVLTFSTAAVVEQAAVEPNMGSDMGESWLNDNSAGSGPYVLDRWDRSVSVTLNANTDYWGGTVPPMTRVIIQNTPEMANLQAAIETGDADIVQDLGSEQVAALEGNPDLSLYKGLSTLLAYVGMNATKAPLDNPDVREAIRYAINYEDIITLLGGNGELVQEIIPIGFLGHTGENPFVQDLDKAKELLANAGVEEGTEIDFMVATGTGPGGIEWSTLGAKIQDDLAKVGLVTNIRQLQQSELLNIYRAQDGELVLMNWGPDFPDPDGNATPFANYEATSLAWRNAWNDPTAIEMSKQAAIELDPDKRAEMYGELVDYVMHNGPYVMLYQPTRVFGVRNNVQGLIYDPNDTPTVSFWLISKE